MKVSLNEKNFHHVPFAGVASSVLVPLQRSSRPCFTQMNWDTELYWSMAYIHLLHMSPSGRTGTAMVIPRSTALTCRQNFVRVIGSVSRPDRWNGTPLFTASRWPRCKSCTPEVNCFTSGRGNFWEVRRDNLNIPGTKETIFAILPWMSPWTPNTTDIQESEVSGDHSGAKCTKGINERWMAIWWRHFY